MSVEAIAIALHHSKARGTAKLVLIGIANHDGDGGAWPSLQTLADYAGVNVRNTQQALATLVKLREIRRTENAGGRPNTPEHLRPNLYHFLLECPPHCDRSRQHRDTRRAARYVPRMLDLDPVSEATPPAASDTPPVSHATPPPVSDATPEPRAKKPSSNPSRALELDARASADYEPLPRCPARPTMAHSYSRSTGRCIDCGGLDPNRAPTTALIGAPA